MLGCRAGERRAIKALLRRFGPTKLVKRSNIKFARVCSSCREKDLVLRRQRSFLHLFRSFVYFLCQKMNKLVFCLSVRCLPSFVRPLYIQTCPLTDGRFKKLKRQDLSTFLSWKEEEGGGWHKDKTRLVRCALNFSLRFLPALLRCVLNCQEHKYP